MKIINLNNSFGITILAALFASTAFFSSCQNNEPGPPKVTNVRETDPATSGMDLKSVNLGAYLVIQGENFTGLRNVYFNGLDAYVYSSYVTNNNIVVQVPDTTPTIATDPDNATNILKIVTDHGEVEHELTILPPPAIIESISNEFALPGEIITLYGKYYYNMLSVNFTGSVQGSILSSSSDGTSCEVIVPNGFLPGHLNVETESGTSDSSFATIFHDTASLTGEFEHPDFDISGNAYIYNTQSNPDVPSIKDKYVYFFGFSVSPGAYFTQSLALETHYMNYQEMFTYPDETLIDPEFSTSKLNLEFEIFVLDPWESGFFEIAFLKPDINDPDAAWRDAYRTFFEYTNITTDDCGKWLTMRIPITEFSVNVEGEIIPLKYVDIKDMPININFKNPNEETGGTSIPVLSIAMDNLRIVKTRE